MNDDIDSIYSIFVLTRQILRTGFVIWIDVDNVRFEGLKMLEQV